jgi:hypothetical protein
MTRLTRNIRSSDVSTLGRATAARDGLGDGNTVVWPGQIQVLCGRFSLGRDWVHSGPGIYKNVGCHGYSVPADSLILANGDRRARRHSVVQSPGGPEPTAVATVDSSGLTGADMDLRASSSE